MACARNSLTPEGGTKLGRAVDDHAWILQPMRGSQAHRAAGEIILAHQLQPEISGAAGSHSRA